MPHTWKLLKATNVLWWWTGPSIKRTGYSSIVVTCSFKQLYCSCTKFSCYNKKQIVVKQKKILLESDLIQFQNISSSSNLICSLVGLVFSQSHVVTWYWYRCLMLFLQKSFCKVFSGLKVSYYSSCKQIKFPQ